MVGDATVPCPLCGEARTADLGEILHPHPSLVAGIEIDLKDTRFRLRGCSSCGFQFKHPRLPEDLLRACYERSSADQWSCSPDPHERQFDRLKAALNRSAAKTDRAGGRRVLDIGCSNGALVQYVGEGWETYGIEPSLDAAKLAAVRGIRILGSDLGSDVPSAFFHAALAIDVLEHIPEPRRFFEEVSRALLPGGVLIVLTGDTASAAWRWQGSRYWYCSVPEHVSFYRVSALDYAARSCGMSTVEHFRLSHIRAGAIRRASEATKNVGFRAAQGLRWLPSASLRSRVLDRRAPGWLSARDHVLYVMRR